MRKAWLLVVIVLTPGSALAQAESPRLVAAKKECWASVGVMGDPNKTRGAIIHMDTVRACVRQKMSGGSGPRR